MNALTPDQQALKDLLARDALVEAERATGLSYKEDPLTMALGMAGHMDLSGRKRQALAATGDSHYGMGYVAFLSLATLEGFVEVHQHEFKDREGRPETYTVLWHPVGILLTAESFSGWSEDILPTVNTAEITFNAKVPVRTWLDRCSTSPIRYDEEHIWTHAYRDVREGFRLALADLRSKVEFITPWEADWDTAWITMLLDRSESEAIHGSAEGKTYQDWGAKMALRRRLNIERARTFPQDVQQAMNVPPLAPCSAGEDGGCDAEDCPQKDEATRTEFCTRGVQETVGG